MEPHENKKRIIAKLTPIEQKKLSVLATQLDTQRDWFEQCKDAETYAEFFHLLSTTCDPKTGNLTPIQTMLVIDNLIQGLMKLVAMNKKNLVDTFGYMLHVFVEAAKDVMLESVNQPPNHLRDNPTKVEWEE
jgi:hypothetical protein